MNKMEARLEADLPERFGLLWNCDEKQFETPLDSRGIADIDAIFELALRTFPGTLPPLDGAERNKHHVYWSEAWWRDYANSQSAQDRQVITMFRGATPQIAYVHMDIHEWIEKIMIPPPAPTIEVMRARNNAWSAASTLLISAYELERARAKYDEKKNNTRRMLGYIAGITPRSQYREDEYVDVIDTEYWLSELYSHLDGWSQLDVYGNVPEEHRLVVPRLSDVRALKRRIRDDAIVPRIPDLAAA